MQASVLTAVGIVVGGCRTSAVFQAFLVHRVWVVICVAQHVVPGHGTAGDAWGLQDSRMWIGGGGGGGGVPARVRPLVP